jgi:hypothetical protein
LPAAGSIAIAMITIRSNVISFFTSSFPLPSYVVLNIRIFSGGRYTPTVSPEKPL